jgi:hypothetical protein
MPICWCRSRLYVHLMYILKDWSHLIIMNFGKVRSIFHFFSNFLHQGQAAGGQVLFTSKKFEITRTAPIARNCEIAL